MGLIVTTTIFSLIAVVMLSLVPGLRLRLWSVVVFVVSEYGGAAGWSVFYARRFVTSSGELTTTAAVVGYFAGVFFSAIVAGIVIVSLVTFVLARDVHRDATPSA